MDKDFRKKLNSEKKRGLGGKNKLNKGVPKGRFKKPRFSGKKKIKKSTGKKVRDFQKKRRAKVIKRFSKKVLDKYGKWIKSIVAWGSVVRDEFTGESDIDIVVIVDDTKEKLEGDFRKKIDHFIHDTAKDVDKKLSPQPVWTITEFWDMVRRLSPLVYTLLKDGIPVYDTGFFAPIKRLLNMGRIPATKEAVEKRMEKVPKRLRRVEHAKLYMIAEDLYYAMLDSTQAVIMFLGRGPPDPNHVCDVARKYLVDKDLIDKKYIDQLEEVIEFRKKVEHKKISEIEGKKLDEYIDKAEKFVEEMNKLLQKLELQKKAGNIQKNYKVMLKASIAALKARDKLPEDPKQLPKKFKEDLIEGGIVNPIYGEVFNQVLYFKKKLKEKDIADISDRDLLSLREYVRRFVGEVKKLFREEDISPEELKKLKPKSIDKGEILKKKGKRKFECEECGKEFKSERGLKIHKGKVHGD